MNRQIAYTGSHGTGKSDAAYKRTLEIKRLNTCHSVIALADLEAFCPYPINTHTTEKAQIWLFSNQILREIEAADRFNVVITDRTLLDIVAYTYVAGFQDLADRMLAYAEHHMINYTEINFKKIEYNPYHFKDGIRDVDDKQFRIDVETVLLELYGKLLDPSVFPGTVHYV